MISGFSSSWVKSVALSEFLDHCAQHGEYRMNDIDATGYWNRINHVPGKIDSIIDVAAIEDKIAFATGILNQLQANDSIGENSGTESVVTSVAATGTGNDIGE